MSLFNYYANEGEIIFVILRIIGMVIYDKRYRLKRVEKLRSIFTLLIADVNIHVSYACEYIKSINYKLFSF